MRKEKVGSLVFCFKGVALYYIYLIFSFSSRKNYFLIRYKLI